MYPYYVELLGQYGWDDADAMFTNYFAKYQQVRGQVFGDQYLDDEGMFHCAGGQCKDLRRESDRYGRDLRQEHQGEADG